MGTRPFTPRTADGPETEVSARDTAIASKRGREAAALLLFALSAFLCLALASLRRDLQDPSVQGSDWVGPVGNLVAGFLAQGFGWVAWLAPLELSLVGAPLFRGRAVGTFGYRLAGDLVSGIILASLVHIAFSSAHSFGGLPAGGNVGLLFGELMRGMFSTVGSFLVGGTVVGLILIGRASFSFIGACQRAWAMIIALACRARSASNRAGHAWLEARELRKEQRSAEALARAPHIETRPSDEAIIAQLAEDDGDWIPLDLTGTPPLSVSQALSNDAPERDGLDMALFSAAQTPSQAPPAETSAQADVPPEAERTPSAELSELLIEQSAAPPPVSSAEKTKGKKRKELGPTIVDTLPARAVERDAPRRKLRKAEFALPSSELLEPAAESLNDVDRDALLLQATLLEKTLSDYGVHGRVEEIHPGPTVTTFEVVPEAGTKVSKVANLSDDLALGLSRTVRIIAPIPGKSRIGFELPNDERVPVNLRELVEDKRFAKLAEKAPLPVVLGRDIVGAPFYADLASMPHVIVAGATGAGKSVGLNVMLSSLLFCRSPDELRLLMIDPKVVELAPFDGIPHMLLPVVTDMKQAATALRWAVDEMERRYQLFANAGTKNIITYNAWVKRVHAGEIPAPLPKDVEALSPDGALVSVPRAKDGEDGRLLPGKLPSIVIVVDEFADLMMQQGKDVEASVARLAQKARAAGMHVVLATQRPSVDVITGMIKANFPSRIAFRVAQKVDSRTILDDQGAELLLGKGDMLVKLNGTTDTYRVQCPFVSEEEVTALTDHLRRQGAPQYHEAILAEPEGDADGGDSDEPVDARFDEAVAIVAQTQRCSTSWLQRKMTIGYNRAAKMVEMMEKQGMVGPPNGAKDREILLPPPQ
jgi:S-DNA-T family DNA segregation ATPase FtsK/SpoIIIE